MWIPKILCTALVMLNIKMLLCYFSCILKVAEQDVVRMPTTLKDSVQAHGHTVLF